MNLKVELQVSGSHEWESEEEKLVTQIEQKRINGQKQAKRKDFRKPSCIW